MRILFSVCTILFGTLFLDAGIVSGQASMSIAPNPYDFGNVSVGQYKDQTFSLTNISGSYLVGDISSVAPFVCVSYCNFSLVDGGVHYFTMRFTPSSSSFSSGSIIVAERGGTGFEGSRATIQGTGVGDSNSTSSPPCPEGQICNPLKSQTLTDLINTLLNFAFTIALVVTPLLVVYAGFLFVVGGSDPKQIEKARNMIIWIVVGLIVIILSKGLVLLLRSSIGV